MRSTQRVPECGMSKTGDERRKGERGEGERECGMQNGECGIKTDNGGSQEG